MMGWQGRGKNPRCRPDFQVAGRMGILSGPQSGEAVGEDRLSFGMCHRSPEAFWGRRWVGNSRCELEAQGRGHGCLPPVVSNGCQSLRPWE